MFPDRIIIRYMLLTAALAVGYAVWLVVRWVAGR